MAQLVPLSIPLRLICLLSHCSDGLTAADLSRLKAGSPPHQPVPGSLNKKDRRRCHLNKRCHLLPLSGPTNPAQLIFNSVHLI
jgi:hypothetical protein